MTEIRYRRTGRDRGLFLHKFRSPGPRMFTDRSGRAVTLRGRSRIWADDRAPDFDRYLEGASMRRRNPRAKAAAQTSGEDMWVLALLVAAGWYLVTTRQGGGGSVAAPGVGSGGGLPGTLPSGTVWISDPFSDGTGEFYVGSTPPGTMPPWREASQYEIQTQIPGGILY